MKKLFAIIALAAIGVTGLYATEFDQWFKVEWPNVSGGGTHTQILDANMKGLKDTSILIPLPIGPGGQMGAFDICVDADSGSTGAVQADVDSIFYLVYLVPIGQALAQGSLINADTCFEAEFADSGATGVFHYKAYEDTNWYSIPLPPPDTAGGSAALRMYGSNKYAAKYAYMQLVVRVTDSTSIGNTVWIRFRSRAAGWGVSGAVGYNKK
jgi:hypothetical protein